MMAPLRQLLLELGAPPAAAGFLVTVVGTVLALLLALGVFLAVRYGVLRAAERVIRANRIWWDDALLDSGVLRRLTHLAPALVLFHLLPLALAARPQLAAVAATGAQIYLLVVAALTVSAAMSAALIIYQGTSTAAEISIQSFVQFLKVATYSLSAISIVAAMLGRTPLYLLSGLGALTAVLLLVFKDPILGFVAGIQLTANRMVRRGDWIEMPRYEANGAVLDVSLTTVKVENWDNTITTIPTYALIADSFKNWRGMQESGGRRIMRALYVDVNTIRFLDEEMARRLSRIEFIREYLARKSEEVAHHNEGLRVDLSSMVNGRRLTNLGTFRAYVSAYVEQHPMVNQEMLHMVRQLPPTPQGLPIEVYAFCRDTAWVAYENVQADIFDHLLAIVPEFGLRVFQEPSGYDLRGLARGQGWRDADAPPRTGTPYPPPP